MGLFGDCFSGVKVLVTGHTGFKGSWLSMWLLELGAQVSGFALAAPTQPSLFQQAGLGQRLRSHEGDVSDFNHLLRVLTAEQPDIVFHLAAQPLVRYSYQHPVETFRVNVLGTAHVLEAVRQTPSVRVCQIITSDKCYDNQETGHAYRETDPMGGHDPYSASKGAAELAVASFRRSFFSGEAHLPVSISSARAGNVIGGGDWALDRIVPDCIRALEQGKPIQVRHPQAVRPWQHVLEPLSGYLWLAAQQWWQPQRHARAYNFGPETGGHVTVKTVVENLIRCWGAGSWEQAPGGHPHEAKLLQLDCSRAQQDLNWRPVFDLQENISTTVAWYRKIRQLNQTEAIFNFTVGQIHAYEEVARQKQLAWAVPAKVLS